MKVSPLETNNKYHVLVPEETKDNSFCPIDPLIMTYYALKFLIKLHCQNFPKFARVRVAPDHPKNSSSCKTLKSFICSMQIDKEVMANVVLQTVDTC